MKDEIITFETAKLAKKAGFNIPVNCYYIKEVPKIIFSAREDGETDYNWNSRAGFSAPTQSLLQKWFRKKHKIIVESTPIDDWCHWRFKIITEDLMKPFFELPWNLKEYKSYKLALDAGLKKALKLIKK